MYIPGAEKLVARLFGGVKAHHRLSPEDLKLTEPMVKELGKGLASRLFMVWLGIVLSGIAAVLIRDRVMVAAVNPIVDNRGFWGWLSVAMIAIMGGCLVSLAFRPVLMRRRFGEDANLYDCYMGTKEGWLPKRACWFWTILAIPVLSLGFLCIFSLGMCIDERGLHVTRDRNGMIPHLHTYQQVTSIELYSQIMARVGQRTVPNLVVRFDNGSYFFYMPDKDKRIPPPDVVAEYISNRAGKPVTVGILRP